MGARVLLHALPSLLRWPLLTSGQLRLANTVLLAPDFPLSTFVEVSVPLLTRLQTAVTVYGDRRDRPLGYAEALARLLGRHTNNNWRILGRLHGAPWPRVTPGGDASSNRVDVIDQTAMQVGLPPGDPEAAINTTMRHTNFSINQMVIDDLAELLTTGRRARERSRLRPVPMLRRASGRAGRDVDEDACVFQFVFS